MGQHPFSDIDHINDFDAPPLDFPKDWVKTRVPSSNDREHENERLDRIAKLKSKRGNRVQDSKT